MEKWMFKESGNCKEKVKVCVSDSDVSWSYFKNGILHTDSLKSKQLLLPRLDDRPNEEKLCIFYAKVVLLRNDNVALKKDVVIFSGTKKDCHDLAEQIKRLIQNKESHRPMNLLVFINPCSGWKTNVKNYQAYVAPLFALCGIQTHVIETTHAYHPTELLKDYDLGTIDAVVSMGGDGSASIVARALISRVMSDAGATLDNARDDLIKPSIALTALPGGSGNAFTMSTFSSYDLETCTLCIILGKRVPYDIVTTHCGGIGLGLSLLVTGIGAITNSINFLDSQRWLAKARYLLLIPTLIYFWQSYNVEIDYLPVRTEDSEQMSTVDDPETTNTSPDDLPLGWKRINRKIIATQVTQWKQRNFFLYIQDVKYRKPDLSCGTMQLRIVKQTSWINFIKRLIADRKHEPADFIEDIKVTECRIRGDRRWNADHLGDIAACDGELVSLPAGPDFSTKVHKDKLDVLAIDDDLVTEARFYAKK